MNRWIATIGAALCIAALPALASPSSEAHVEAMLSEMQAVPAGAEADYIVDQVDMARLSKFVLGRHGRGVSPEEFNQFSIRLDAYLRDFLSSRSDDLGGAHLEVISSVDRSGTNSIVTTRVWSTLRDPMIVRWRVLNRDGAWRLVDVEVHGLWLAIEQRAQVSVILGNGAADVDDLYLPEERALPRDEGAGPR